MRSYQWLAVFLLCAAVGEPARGQTVPEARRMDEGLNQIQAVCDQVHPRLSGSRTNSWAAGASLQSWTASVFAKPGTSGRQIHEAREALASCAAGAFENSSMISNYSSEEIDKFTRLTNEFLVEKPKTQSASYARLAAMFPESTTIQEPQRPVANAPLDVVNQYNQAKSLRQFDLNSVQCHTLLKGMAGQLAEFSSTYERELIKSIEGCAKRRGNNK